MSDGLDRAQANYDAARPEDDAVCDDCESAARRIEALREQVERLESLCVMRGVEAAMFRKERDDAKAEVARLKAAIESKHDYGPASLGEQDNAWRLHCQGQGWDPSSHPAARDAFCSGYILGDAFSSADDDGAIGVLRSEVFSLRADLARMSEELGLPPTIGPAPGELRRILDQRKEDEQTIRNMRPVCDAAMKWRDELKLHRYVNLNSQEAFALVAACDKAR